MIDIAVCKNRKDKVYENHSVTFEQLAKRLSTTVYTKESYEEYLKLPKSQQDDIKDVGGFVGGYLIEGKRSKSTVRDRSILTLDVDYGYPGMIDEIYMMGDFRCVIYTTHKHNGARERFRIVIPLSRKVDAVEYEAVGRKLAEKLGIEYFDDTTYEPSRLMYFPSTSKDGEFRFLDIDDEILEVDKYLASYENHRDANTWPKSSRVQKVSVSNNQKQQNPLEKENIVGAFCKTYDIHGAIEKYLKNVYSFTEDRLRYTYVNGTTSGGLVVYEDGNFAYSHHSSDPCGQKLCNSFDLVKNHLFKEFEEDVAYEKMVEMAIGDEATMKTYGELTLEIAKREFGELADTPPGDSPAEVPPGDANTPLGVNGVAPTEVVPTATSPGNIKSPSGMILPIPGGVDGDANEDDDNTWLLKLKVNKKGGYLSTINNIVIIMENDKNLKGKIALNEFTHQICIKGRLPWSKNNTHLNILVWTDMDDSDLRHYVETVYNIKAIQAIYDAISVVARKNSFHPIKDYLNNVTWDKVPRMENLFIDYLGAENNSYTKAVTRKILAGAISRIFKPGTKFDYMTVLVGPEGLGKSHLIGKLGKDWYTDSITTVIGKEAYEQLQEAWIVEMAELSAIKKAEGEAVKHFISKQEDTYRVAYGRRVEKFKRQCVFFGTTNKESFLKDDNGNRRFWPVKVGVRKPKKSVFNDLSECEVDNIWAEAMEIYKSGEKLILENEDARVALDKQLVHQEESPKEGMIREYLKKPLPKAWDKLDIEARRMYISQSEFSSYEKDMVKRTKVCAMEIWVELFGGDPKMLSPMHSREINDILRRIDGWKAYDNGSGKLRFGNIYGLQKAFILET